MRSSLFSRFPLPALKQLAVLFLCLLSALVSSVFAHDPGLSTALVRLRTDGLEATLTLSLRDTASLAALAQLDSDAGISRPSGTSLTAEELRQELRRLAPTALEVQLNGQPVAIEISDTRVEQANAIVSFRVQANASSNLWLRSKWLASLPTGHRQFLTIEGVDGQTLAEQLLSADEDAASVRLASTSGPVGGGIHRPSFGEFLVLGTKHILIGYDHLLFLFSLLMVTRGWGTTFKLISSFTLAHSATLALATVGVIDLPGRVVEPLIAASIIYVGVENFIRGQAPKGRAWMTFAFGLIHGLGFASVLRDLGIDSTSAGVFVPLVSFNLGVELGQLLVAALLLPLLWLISQRPLWTKRWVPACSGLVTLAGSYWFVERLWL